ncbi:MAG: RidA family protein [Pseudomonadota bacterium]
MSGRIRKGRRGFTLPMLALALTGCATAPAGPEFDDPSNGTGSFSRAVLAGELIFLAGVLGTADGALVSGGITAETIQAIRNIERALAVHDLTLADVVKFTVFLADVNEFDSMNTAYRAVFAPPRPARTTIGGADVVLDARIEIECIAGR